MSWRWKRRRVGDQPDLAHEQLSGDPADTTGTRKRHTDEPTEPPNNPKGTGGGVRWRLRARVEEVIPRSLRERALAIGNVDDHGRGLVKANELPGDSPNAVRDPAHVQVAVTTPIEPNAPHARARAEQLWRWSGGHVSTCRTRQRGRRRIERTRLRGRMSALVHGWSTRRAVENDQHILTIDERIQEDPPELPPLPDEPGQ